MSSKGCSEVKQVAVSTLQEKNILQKSKVLSTKSHERTDASSENITSPFIPLLIFPFGLQR